MLLLQSILVPAFLLRQYKGVFYFTHHQFLYRCVSTLPPRPESRRTIHLNVVHSCMWTKFVRNTISFLGVLLKLITWKSTLSHGREWVFITRSNVFRYFLVFHCNSFCVCSDSIVLTMLIFFTLRHDEVPIFTTLLFLESHMRKLEHKFGKILYFVVAIHCWFRVRFYDRNGDY